MALAIELPGWLERELTAEAARLGLSLSEYVIRILENRDRAERPKTGAEIVAFWEREGLIGSRKDISDSQQHARDLRRQAERRSQ